MTIIGSVLIQGILDEGSYGKIFQVKLPSSEIQIMKAFITRKDFTEFFQYVLREIFFGQLLLQNHYISGTINVFEDNTVIAGYLQTKAKGIIKDLFPMSLPDIASKFKDVVDQLHNFHNQDMIHRDIKPQNILYDINGLYLIDTSLSIRSSVAESNLKTVITLWYRPLEILKGKAYTSSADIWSLGLTLLEAYTGKALLMNMDKENDVIKFLQQYFVPNKVIIPGKSKEEICFNNLLTCMLQLNPVNRASIFDIVHHEFWTIETTTTPSTTNISTVPKYLRPCNRNDLLYFSQMTFSTEFLHRNETLPKEERIALFDLVLKFTINHALPFNIALLAFYFIDFLVPYNKEKKSLLISCLFASITLESDISLCMKTIAKFFTVSPLELESLFTNIVSSFHILIQSTLPNTYRKARYIHDIRIIPLHMIDSTVWKFSLSQLQRLFTCPNTADEIWLEKIMELEQSTVYKELWINQLEQNQTNISYYF